MSETSTVINPMSMNTALYYYNQFMDNFAFPHNYNGKLYTHSVPSSFIYYTVKDGCVWLLPLILGIGGYSVYFDDDTQTSKLLSLELLNGAGVKDPALVYNSSIIPWEGLLSEGRSPMAPTDKIVDGLGLPYLNGEDLLPIYRADPVQAILPEIDPDNGFIVYNNGVMQTKKYTLCISEEVSGEDTDIQTSVIGRSVRRSTKWIRSEDDIEETEIKYTPIIGWGMSYNNYEDENNKIVYSSLPLICVNDSTNSMCYSINSTGVYCLKTKFAGKDIKKIGPNYGKPVDNTEYMTRLEATPFLEWSKYHLNDKLDRFYIPIYWMSKNWSPFISWHKETQTNSIQMIMMASAISSTGILSVDSMQGKSLSAITTNFLNQSLNSNEKDKLRRIVANTQRAISLVEFIKRV